MANILIVDDDKRILGLLENFLSQKGYQVTSANSAKEAKKLFENQVFDLIILDVMMPEVTGFEFSAEIKKLNNVPIILLTALSKVEDRIKGLESGADDYLSKPFEPKELLLRMQNLLDLYAKQQTDSPVAHFDNKSYNLATKELKIGQETIHLTSSEHKLLEFFIKNKNQILSRQDLLNQMGHVSLRSIDVQIVRLRAKIELDSSRPKHLQTIRNAGYAFYI